MDQFDDVLEKDIQVEEISSCEFEFDDGKWCLKRERNHWEIQFESENGEECITLEREDFINGIFTFDIDNRQYTLSLEDFDRIETFFYEKCL